MGQSYIPLLWKNIHGMQFQSIFGLITLNELLGNRQSINFEGYQYPHLRF